MPDFDVPEFRNDHDALIAMYVEIRNLRVEIRELNKQLQDTPTQSQVSDHEARIRRLELWGAIALGLAYALQFYFNFLKQ